MAKWTQRDATLRDNYRL